MNFYSVIIFVIIGVVCGQGFKEIFCLSSVHKKDMSCEDKKLLYVTSETFGPANYNNKTCGVDLRYTSCIYKPLDSTRNLTTGSNCNGNTKCTIQTDDLKRIFEQYLHIIQSMCEVLRHRTSKRVALEIEYQCMSGDGLGSHESLTTPSIRATENSLRGPKVSSRDNYIYIAVSVSVVIFLICFISIAICLYRRNKSNLNVKNIEKENRDEQRLYDYPNVNTLMNHIDNVHYQNTNNSTHNYNQLTFSERQQYQEQNRIYLKLYETVT